MGRLYMGTIRPRVLAALLLCAGLCATPAQRS